MTHQNHQTNGASLEDCHTNFYALTDLCGIKWRKFVNGERTNPSSDPLDDPILRSYSRCMQADILCVWRRVQSTKPDNTDPNSLVFEITTSKVHPPLSLAAAKELWIFWYGEEPDLSDLVDAELLRIAANQSLWNGTWKGQLTYECRSLLFKALHNLMERFVLTKDIVRLGKWFVQPCTSNDRLFDKSSQHLSFSFTFFVHGDTVCASIDLREHPAVRPLTKKHLDDAATAFAAATNSTQQQQQQQQQSQEQNGNALPAKSPTDVNGIAAGECAAGGGASNNNNNNSNNNNTNSNNNNSNAEAVVAAVVPKPRKVILAPFGMAAVLTGNSYKASDPMAEKILDDWVSFFPLCNKDNTDVPPVVEVVSGGHKMYHPANYVLVTDLDDMEDLEKSEQQKRKSPVAGALATASSPEASALSSTTAITGALTTSTPTTTTTAASAAAARKTITPTAKDTTSKVASPIATTPTTPENTTGTTISSSSATSATQQTPATIAAFSESAISALERLSFQPYYDQRPTSGFTFNTSNTHIPPTAAVEMPERAWQDCITNPLNVTAHANNSISPIASTSITSSSSSSTTTNATSSSPSTGTSSATTASSSSESASALTPTGNGSGNSNSSISNALLGEDTKPNMLVDSKHLVQQQIQMQLQQQQQQQQQQLLKRQKLWGFVDPLQKAPCICTNSQNSSNKTKTTHNSAANVANVANVANTMLVTSMSVSSGMAGGVGGAAATVALRLSQTVGKTTQGSSFTGHVGNSNSGGVSSGGLQSSIFGSGSHHHHQANAHHYFQQQLQQQQQSYNRPSTPLNNHSVVDSGAINNNNYISNSSHSRSSHATKRSIPFHKRFLDDLSRLTAAQQHKTAKSSTTHTATATTAMTKSYQIKSSLGGNTNSAFYQTSTSSSTTDTIPKPRNLPAIGSTPHGTPHGGASTYSRNSIGDSMPVPSVGSPATPAPSPHPNSANSQPTSVPPAEQLLQMSPHAPTSVSNLQQPPTPIDHLLDKNTPAPTPTDQHDSKSITASPYVQPTPSVEPPPYNDAYHAGGNGVPSVGGPGSVPLQQPPSVGRCTPTICGSGSATNGGQQQQQQPPPPQQGTITVKKFELQRALTPIGHINGNGGGFITEIKQEPGLACHRISDLMPVLTATHVITEALKLYKPPQVIVLDSDCFPDDDWLKDIVYDFAVQESWDSMPVKRHRPNEPTPITPRLRRLRQVKNIYEGHTHFKPLMPSPGSVYGPQLLSIDASANAIGMAAGGGHGDADHLHGGGGDGIGLVGIAGAGSMTHNGSMEDGDGSSSMTSGFFPGAFEIKKEPGTSLSPCKESKSSNSSGGGNLYTAEGLNPSLHDLEQLFETSSNDECSSVQIHTPPDSNNPSNGGIGGCCSSVSSNTIDELKRSTTVASVVAAAVSNAAAMAALQNSHSGSSGGGSNNNSNSGGANTIQAEDLTKMFPTPPSHEQQHPNSSPCQMDIQMTDLSVITTQTTTLVETACLGVAVGLVGAQTQLSNMIKIKQEYSIELGSPIEEPIDDWSFVYQPPNQEKYVGSSRYAPLTNLPSHTLPTMMGMRRNSVYKPTYITRKSRAAAKAKAAAVAAAAQQQQQQQLVHQQQHQQQQHHHHNHHHQQQQQHQHQNQNHYHQLHQQKQQQLHQQHHLQQHQLQQQQQQQLQQQHTQKHQQLHELLSAGPRTPMQQPRTPLGNMSATSPMHNNTVPTPLNSGGSNLLLNQLNCPQAALTNTLAIGGSAATMQQLMQRAGMSPISPAGGGGGGGGGGAAGVPFPRGSPMLQQRQTPIHPPPPYELAVASPATSTSSYLNKQYNSQEQPRTPQSVGMPHMHAGNGGHHGGMHGGHGGGQSLAFYTGGSGHAGSGTSHGGVNATSNGLAHAMNELPEVSSVMVNILLYDTALNVFRDHNFDSSTVCVCNADTHKIGNIRGADSGVYVPLPGGSFNPSTGNENQQLIAGLAGASGSGLRMLNAAFGSVDSPASMTGPGSGHTGSGGTSTNSSSSTPPSSNQHITGYVDDDPVDCTCGFSAVVNRRLSYRAGLFYEDEMEITGIADDPGRHKQPTLLAIIKSLCQKKVVLQANDSEKAAVASSGTQVEQALAYAIFDMLLDQCSIIHTTSSSVHRALLRVRRQLSRPQQRRQSKSNAAGTALSSSVASIANVLEVMDAHDIICLALEQARLAYENQRMDMTGDFGGSSHAHHGSAAHQQHQAAIALRNKLLGGSAARLTVHKWPFIPVGYTRSNKEIVRTMNSIQPMLQHAFHSKTRSAAGAKDATYKVSGPLTWRQFHRLAGRASGQCEPQPIPSVIVGYDKDWISVAPHSIHYWDKFLLEPYSYARDVVYVIICPDNEYVTSSTRNYFRELSSTYEMCKLGRHTPMRGWDGMLTVGVTAGAASANANMSAASCASGSSGSVGGRSDSQTTPLDEWLRTLDNPELAEQLRRYAFAFLQQLAPYLSRIPTDKTLLNPPDQHGTGSAMSGGSGMGARPERANASSTSPSNASGNTMSGTTQADAGEKTPKLEPGTNNNNNNNNTNNNDQSGVVNPSNAAANVNEDIKPDISKVDIKPALVLGDPLGVAETLEDINPPAIVLYVVNPFTFAADSTELERLALIALFRCYAELMKQLPDSVCGQLNIQIISLESIMELGLSGSRKRFSDDIKCLALNIFSQCRRHMLHAQTVKSLTGFGTAANTEAFLKTKDEQNRRAYRMYTPPFVLAPMHERNDKTDFSRASDGMRGPAEQKYSVMYCNYCLSEDQSWLLATATDDRGEMLEKVCINIDVPNRARRRKAPARYIALKKLMDFIMGLISQTSQTWRIVIGRIGRIGHSELKSWSYLLSKQQLQKASKQFKDMCKQCALMYPPTILSACLVTLEPDAKLRVMPDQFTPDERFSQISMQNPLSTPQDVTCTHILVFPTSAVCLSFTRQFPNEPQVDLENDFLTTFEEEENEGFSDGELGDLFWDTSHMDRVSNHGSPGRIEDNRSWQSSGGNNFKCSQQQDVEEVGSLNQQPLAVGYMVSTAPTGRMPAWFWAACPHLEDVCPVFLKTALHLHVPNIQTTDDILNSTNAHQSANDHPLDSMLTADVLRFVLEGYNALSWLALDSNTHDRLSCLPINVQTLMDLYYLTAAIA